MPGVRLRHPTARGGVFLVEDLARPYGQPLYCAACSTALQSDVVHHVKTYHLALDGEGTVIVSQGIYDRIKTIPALGGLELVNEVAEPPPQRLEMNGRAQRFAMVPDQRGFRPFQGGR